MPYEELDNPLYWYSWRLKNWGVESNALYTDRLAGIKATTNSLVFITKNSPALFIVTHLSKSYPYLIFDYTWADEDIGYNLGRIVIQNGVKIQTYHFTPGDVRSFDFAAEVLNIDLGSPANYELAYDVINNEYVSIE